MHRSAQDNLLIYESKSPEELIALFSGRGVVYFVSGNELIKIGHSTRIDSRLRNLRDNNASSLLFIGSIEASYHLELYLHAQYDAVRHHGEWFKIDPAEIEEVIRRYNGTIYNLDLSLTYDPAYRSPRSKERAS